VLFFHEKVSRAGKIFSLTVIALFGVMCLLGFFQRFPYLGADEWLIGIAGAALLVFDFLLWRYFRKPRLILSDSGMTESRLFGQREFRYAELVSLASYVEKLYPTGPNGTSSVPIFLHRLMVRTRDGRERTITLPDFGYNATLVDALAARSGMTVERLPNRERKR
jgi:hypothetical protein